MVTRHVNDFATLRLPVSDSATLQTSPRQDEAIEDLAETLQIINDLSMAPECDKDYSAADVMHSLFATSSTFGQAVLQLKAHYHRCMRLLEKINLTDRALLRENLHNECLALKSAARAAYRQRGALLCALDWQSPFYAGSLTVELNRLTTGIAEHKMDYKRDGHLDAGAYEEQFLSEYTAHLGSSRLKAYLTNCGMAAFSTVIHWVADEHRLSGSSLALSPAYFENLHLARAFFPDMLQVDALSGNELLKVLRERNPSIIICDVVTNCGEVLAHDVETLLNWCSNEATHKTALIIDTTCLPLPLLRPGILQSLPERVSVFFVESLAKHHQYGLDMVTGGIVVAHMSENHHESFAKTRARFGANIADASVGSLPSPHRERITRRMQRHSRNTKLIAEGLEDRIRRKPEGALEAISWLTDTSALAPWFRGSCLSVHFKPEFRSIRHYQQYEQIVSDLAAQRNVPVAYGTSFGFDVTRLYVTAPSTAFEPPFLRIAAGTETLHGVRSLIDVFNDASLQLARTAEPIHVQAPQTITLPIRRPRISEPAGENAFIGENALYEYLSPENYPASPLVELPTELNPLREDGVRLFAKMTPLVPLMNIKSIPAFSMLSKAAERGDLEGVRNVIESSSGNTVLSLSIIAKLFGIDTTCAIVDHSIAPSLARLLRLFGIELHLHPSIGHELFGKIEPRSIRATKTGSQPGWINPGQYANPDNPDGFAKWLGPDIWNQTGGNISLLSCALGTCGTMVGVSRALREQNPDVQVISCVPIAGQAIPGPREKSLLADVSFDWKEVANDCMEITAEEGFAASIQLLRRGIMGGPSSGMNYAGALAYLQRLKREGKLKDLVAAKGGEFWTVFLCCDTPMAHVDEYYDVLGDEYFPPVKPVPELIDCNA
ncbi:MAG: pyridoxal-phosphate dependent enzyme [Candidatus Obscuribacterales bacterium]|nr:pyridoxal-phosphate dependent enzyme [Candidatus Obscuribacterales bacterium]